jgi:hypothetical protein
LPLLDPFSSTGVGDIIQVDEHDLVLLDHEHGFGLESLVLASASKSLVLASASRSLALGSTSKAFVLASSLDLQYPSLGNGFVSATDLSWRSTKLSVVASLSLRRLSSLSAMAYSFLTMSSLKVSLNAKEPTCRAMSALVALWPRGRRARSADARPSPGLPRHSPLSARLMTPSVDALSLPLPFFFSSSCQKAKISSHFLESLMTIQQ